MNEQHIREDIEKLKKDIYDLIRLIKNAIPQLEQFKGVQSQRAIEALEDNLIKYERLLHQLNNY